MSEWVIVWEWVKSEGKSKAKTMTHQTKIKTKERLGIKRIENKNKW